MPTKNGALISPTDSVSECTVECDSLTVFHARAAENSPLLVTDVRYPVREGQRMLFAGWLPVRVAAEQSCSGFEIAVIDRNTIAGLKGIDADDNGSELVE